GILALSDEDQAAAIAIVAADPAMAPFLDGRSWIVTHANVWRMEDLPLGVALSVDLDPPVSGSFEVPAVIWRNHDDGGSAAPVRDADGSILPEDEQFDLGTNSFTAIDASPLLLFVSLAPGRVVGVVAFSFNGSPGG